MERKGRPFVVYRRGPMSFTIVPRGTAGWVQFCLWLALVVPLLVWFGGYLALPPLMRTDFGAVLALFVFGMLAWGVCGLWWMLARAEVIDVVVYERDKQRAQARRERAQQEPGP